MCVTSLGTTWDCPFSQNTNSIVALPMDLSVLLSLIVGAPCIIRWSSDINSCIEFTFQCGCYLVAVMIMTFDLWGIWTVGSLKCTQRHHFNNVWPCAYVYNHTTELKLFMIHQNLLLVHGNGCQPANDFADISDIARWSHLNLPFSLARVSLLVLTQASVWRSTCCLVLHPSGPPP